MQRTPSAPQTVLRLGVLMVIAVAIALGFSRTSAEDPPSPIDPTSGEGNLLDLINSIPLNDVESALDHFPVPYVAVASANGAEPTIVNKNAGSPTRIDADRSKTTGKGGDDIEVEVNTELLPTPHIRININRITSPSDATDLQVLVAFPFQAFNDEGLPSPNLFIGYQTRAAGDTDGGIAPLTEEFRILPGTLSGTSHDFILQMSTAGQVNPVRFIAGHFDGNAADGILNALGMSAYMENVPGTVEIGLDLDQDALTTPGFESGSVVDFEWSSSAPTKVIFDYFEEEGFPIGGSGTDYGATLTYNPMPTSLTLGVDYDNSAGAGGVLAIEQTSNVPVDEMTLSYHRQDGLLIEGTATDVPTDTSLAVDFAGSAVLDVNADTLDLRVQVTQDGGFIDTEDFLGYNLGYAEFGVENAPSLTAGYVPASDSFGVQVTDSSKSIDAVWLVVGDDDDLELPPGWGTTPSHIFSLVDDGSEGTAAARVVFLKQATLTLDASPVGETFDFLLEQPASPMQLYLETEPTSLLTNEDILVQCDIVNMPYGDVDFTIDFPDQFSVNADPSNQVINDITCAGHVGNLNFELGVGSLPMGSGYLFDANGKLEVTVEPGGVQNTATIGFIRVRLWNEVEALPSPFSLAPLLSTPLHDARLRVDQIPSFIGTWSDGPATAFDFKAGKPESATLFIGGVQVLVSTVVELTTPLPVASATGDDFVTFADLGAGQAKRLGAGVFGLNEFTYNSTDAAGQMSMTYKANAAHRLVIDVDSRFGGDFFPTYDIDLTFTLDAIPAEFSLTTEFNPLISWNGSDGIASIVLDGFVDNSGPSTADRTHVRITASSLPSQLALNIDPATGATLGSNDTGTMDLSLLLESNSSIFGTPYALIEAALTGIPAKFNASWSGGQFLLEFKDASDNPSKLGTASALISTSSDDTTNANRRAEFAQTGPDLAGPVTADGTGCRINYSPFMQEVDRRYHTAGSPSVLSRLNLLYCDSEILDAGEDHLVAIIAGGALQFASAQLSDLQKVAYQPDADGGHYELLIPTAGTHPLFAGVKFGDEFLTAQISNVPDSLVLDIDTAAQVIDFAASEVVTEIDLYWGKMPAAGDGDTALRALIEDFPSTVHIEWGFGFPSGGVTFEASNPFELLVLFQDGSNRLVGGLELQDLTIGYNVDFPSLDLEEDACVVPGPGLDPCGDDCILCIPTALSIVKATAGIFSDSGVDGFFGLYDNVGGVQALTGTCPDTCPAPGANEYVPLLSFLMKDFTELSVTLNVQVDPLPEGASIFPIDIEFTPALNGQFVFDVWSSADTDFTFDTTDAFFGLIGFRNEPDYTENSPFHIIPGLFEDPIGNLDFSNPIDAVIEFNGWHGFGEHIDPFAP